MEQLTFVAPGNLEWRDVPVPVLEGDGQALVRPLAVSRCDLDTVIALGRAPAAGPFALGHEMVAEVLEVGDAVATVRPGDRVSVPFQISCGVCDQCRRGNTGSCTEVPRLASYGLAAFSGVEYGGGLSDCVRVPFADAMLVPLPAELEPADAAAASDNLSDGVRTVSGPLRGRPGAPVLIAAGGAPSIGLYAVAAARALGASEVVYVDPNASRCARAENLGARVENTKPEPGQKLGRFPITVDATSRPGGLRFTLASTEDEGTCTSVGIYFVDTPLPLLDMYTRGVRFLTGRVHARHVAPEALELLRSGRMALDGLGPTVVDWADAADAWGEKSAKLVVRR